MREELDEKMIALWNDGLSAQRIAFALRAGLTRNAIIGRISRMTKAGDARITRLPGGRPVAVMPRPLRVVSEKRERPVKLPPAEEPDDSCRTTLLAIGSGKCRFIIGEPSDMICCGHPGFPYCGYHAAITHTKGKSDEADVAA